MAVISVVTRDSGYRRWWYRNDETDAYITFEESSGFLHAPDPINAEGYALSADEARHLADALNRYADSKEQPR